MPDETEKKVQFKSLAINLALTFFVLTLIILITARSLDLYSDFTIQQQFIVNQQRLIAQEAANTVKSFIQEKFSILNTSVRLGELSGDQPDKEQLTLEKLLGTEPAFRQLIFLNSQGEEILRTSRLSNQMQYKFSNEEKKNILSRIKQEKTYIGPIFIDELNNEPLVLLAVPAFNLLGDFRGVLVSEVNLKFMWDLVGRMKIGKHGQAYVVDKKGDLIAFGDISRVLARENLTHIKEVNQFVNSQKPISYTKISISKGILGNDVVTTYFPLETPDWAVMIELPVREAYDFMIQVIVRAVVVLLFSLTLTILAGVYLSRRITKPIITLRDTAFEISKGNLASHITITSQDEIGQLANAFNQMAIQLQQSYGLLEQKVKERTEELEKSKKQLEVNITELERMNKLMVGRELRMAELKKELDTYKSGTTPPPAPPVDIPK